MEIQPFSRRTLVRPKNVFMQIDFQKTKELEKILPWIYKENLVFRKCRYVMGSTQVYLLNIVRMKVGIFAALKMCIRARLEKFVWSTLFAECAPSHMDKLMTNMLLWNTDKTNLRSLFVLDFLLTSRPPYSHIHIIWDFHAILAPFNKWNYHYYSNVFAFFALVKTEA